MPDAKHIKSTLIEAKYAYDLEGGGSLYFVRGGASKEWKEGQVLATLQAAGDAASGQDMVAQLRRLTRHVSTLCALLNGVAVNAALDERRREIRDTIKKEIGE